MVQACGARDVDGYAQMMLDFSNMLAMHTHDVLSLEDILLGNAIARLSEIIKNQINPEAHILYDNWLTQANNEKMFDKSTR
jgi:hypothetical protein